MIRGPDRDPRISTGQFTPSFFTSRSASQQYGGLKDEV
jgi:hypothetical protein